MRKSNLVLILPALLATTATLAQSGPPPGPPPGGMPMGPPPGGEGGGPPGGFPNMPSMADTDYVAALEVKDGAIVGAPDPALKGGKPTATTANGVTLDSNKDALNGVIVAGGQSAFTLSNAKIRLSGAGTNDFLGTGAGVMVRDHGTMVLNSVDIETNGRISSAAVAAEGSELRIYNSRLVANGGPLPANYKPVIGPGMMEPPAPLGLTGTARTVLAMSNSRTFIYDSEIIADAWGAVSTDATGGNLYLEVNRSKITVRRAGYGVYSDFGAHVVVNDSVINSGAHHGIIAGKARVDFTNVSGHATGSSMMIHSVMAFDPAETATFNVTGGSITTGGPAILVKSANADIALTDVSISSGVGVVLEVRKNDDPNATQTKGAVVPGVHMTLAKSTVNGDVVDSDPDRTTYVTLTSSRLNGSMQDVVLSMDSSSAWIARSNSVIELGASVTLTQLDAPSGVTISARVGKSAIAPGHYPLASGGTLIVSP